MHQELGIYGEFQGPDHTYSIVSIIRQAEAMIDYELPKWVRLGSTFINSLKTPIRIGMEPIVPYIFNQSFQRIAYTMWVLLSSTEPFIMRIPFGRDNKYIFALKVEYDDEETDDDSVLQIDHEILSVDFSSLNIHRKNDIIQPGPIEDWDGILRLSYEADARNEIVFDYETIVPFMNLFRRRQTHQYHLHMCKLFILLLAEMYQQFGLFIEFPEVAIDMPTQSYINQFIIGQVGHSDWIESAFQFIRSMKALSLRPPRRYPGLSGHRSSSGRRALKNLLLSHSDK